MRVLTVHNYVGDRVAGGEGGVFEAESRLLAEHGHEVLAWSRTNAEAMNASMAGKIRAAWRAPWSTEAYREIRERIDGFQPDIIHIHNIFLMLSPSVFRAARDAGVPTVATLHNYRLLSPCSQLLRKGRICERCLNRNPWRIMLYRCYNNSVLASFLRYLVYHASQRIHHWMEHIDGFIVLSRFGKKKFIAAGLPRGKIHVKPNFIPDPLEGRRSPPRLGRGALFVGRLSTEKGVDSLLKAWRKIDYPLTLVGDGPLRDQVRAAVGPGVHWAGEVGAGDVFKWIRKSAFLVMPSIWYEPFGLVNIEAMAMGRAVVGSGLGAQAEIVKHRETGLLFEPGDPADLRAKVNELTTSPKLMETLGRGGRRAYLQNYLPEKNYQALASIYRKVMETSGRKG